VTDQAARPATKGTRYIVFSGSDGAWRKIVTVTAQSANAAIRQAASSTDAPTGLELVAVPERSWKPRKVTVETAPRVKLS
jgi:hypothetical protein